MCQWFAAWVQNEEEFYDLPENEALRKFYSDFTDLKQWWPATPRTTPRKNEFIFYRRTSHMPRSVQCVYPSQNLPKLNTQCQLLIPNEIREISLRRSHTPKYPELGHFTLFCRERLRNVQRITVHVHTRQLLFCSLNLLFCGVLVAVVVLCLRSLLLLKIAPVKGTYSRQQRGC